MARTSRNSRDVVAVLSTYAGAERALVESALDDARLSRRRAWTGRLAGHRGRH